MHVLETDDYVKIVNTHSDLDGLEGRVMGCYTPRYILNTNDLKDHVGVSFLPGEYIVGLCWGPDYFQYRKDSRGNDYCAVVLSESCLVKII